MKMIDRLQEEYEYELSRLKTVISSSTPDDSRLFTRRLGQYNDESNALENMESIQTYGSVQSLPNVELPRFSVLMEEFRKSVDSYNRFNRSSGINMLNMEKTSPSSKAFCKNVWMVHGKCSHYEIIRTKLKQIHAAIAGDSNIVESGFEDVISSADSITEEHAHLKNEIKKLSGRLCSAREKIIELRAYFARCSCDCMESFESWQNGQPANDHLAAGSTWIRRKIARDSSNISKIEQLKAENVLLNARLAESAELVKMLVREYSDQLNKTSLLGRFIRSIYSIDGE
uniref:Uncharacterized protein n=1 Tax=Loa loa TaxID=7209 RepID=A0A1I7W3V9_LOALO